MRYTISLLLASLAASPTLAEVPAVVTDIPPVHSLVAMVMGDLGSPVLLLDQGADAHDFQLRPSQAQAVQDARLVVWIGPEMSPWLDRVLDGMGSTAPQLPLLGLRGTATLAYGDDTDNHAGHDHGDEEHAEAAGDAHEGHDHSGADPHAWLLPSNASVWVQAIADELARLDPANAASYAANAKRAQLDIAAAAARAAAALDPVKDRPVIVNHDAYAYFAKAFGLTSVGHIAEGDAASPGAAALRDLIAAAQDKGAACVFPEANHDAGLAEQVAADAGARLGGALDPEGAGLTPGAGLYPALITGIADTMAACLSQP